MTSVGMMQQAVEQGGGEGAVVVEDRRPLFVRFIQTSRNFNSDPVTTAFPVFLAVRLPHQPFRGLLGVHSHYGLHVRQVS
jgi:hypothetical protein